jgi:cysteinyl-tRNA synthetase
VLRLHDTAIGRVVDVSTREPGKVAMYVCGPTVYDVPHIGHGRFSLVFDVLRRYLEWSGVEVRYVSNITDIDDKIIQRANREGSSMEQVARTYEAVWWDVMDRLNVKRPDADPHATAYVDRMIALVTELFEAGKAYETSDGVYLSVDAVPGYGLLARQPLDSLRAGARVETADEKRSPQDFALWKKAKPGEPSWASPWGEGRPGWHTECVVMSLDLLGEGFDLHGGGQDLAFPHHENERAQAVAAGREFARHWVHNGFVEVGGEKMSKSLANFTTLTDLLALTDPRAYRLVVLQSHYRAPVEVTPRTLEQAAATLAGLDDFARRTAGLAAVPPDTGAVDTPAVVAHLSDLRRRANILVDAGDTGAAAPLAAAVREIAGALGLVLAGTDDEVDPAAAALVAARDEARAARDFATADEIRGRLQALGWTVEDTPQGTRIHR